jgi:hypothetical protein
MMMMTAFKKSLAQIFLSRLLYTSTQRKRRKALALLLYGVSLSTLYNHSNNNNLLLWTIVSLSEIEPGKLSQSPPLTLLRKAEEPPSYSSFDQRIFIYLGFE